MNYKIYPLHLGDILAHEKSSFTYQTDQGTKIRCPLLSFLLKSDDGRNILVDTGPCDEAWGEKYHTKLEIPSGATILEVLKNQFDLEPSDIDYIINTHLHWDHCFSNHLFSNKKIYVQKKELDYALDPLPIHRVTYESPQFEVNARFLDNLDQFIVVDGDTPIDDGIELILLSGHSEGLQGVMIDTESGKYLLASDSISIYENWQGNGKLPHIIPGLHSDIKACFESYDKIEKLEKMYDLTIIPSHDFAVLNKKVYK